MVNIEQSAFVDRNRLYNKKITVIKKEFNIYLFTLAGYFVKTLFSNLSDIIKF